ncbi:MAG: right-handed parallel beta-helix repeat-containing protein [Planctomycetota bacterium]|nr:right-handed parallel beta-helix repeat-containing protein [Planctomycetota bacterium]
MKTSSFRSVLRALSSSGALVVLAAHARAGDWYVDVVTGSNANAGTTAAAPWRTISHALSVISTLPNDVQTVHVAPGLYDAAAGEAFPWFPAPRTRIVGTLGSAQTIVVGSGSAALLSYGPNATLPVDAQSGADGLTLRSAATAISVGASGGSAAPAFHDIRVENATGPGVRVSASSSGPFGGASARATFERLEVVQCSVGVVVAAQGGGLGSGNASIDLSDSVIRSSAGDGIQCTAAGNAGASVSMRRSRVLDNGGNGVYSNSGGGVGAVTSSRLTADACLFAGNGGSGILGEGTGSTFGGITLNDCTIADNSVCGVRGSTSQNATLWDSILALNGDDLDLFYAPTASFTDCANGDLAGFPNCIAADPLFVDSSTRDYRLRFGSPCIDRGDPTATGRIDLVGHARPYDGDLDTVAVMDLGALEFAPLALVGVPRIGTTVSLEITGPTSAPTTLYSSRTALVVIPAHTTFGALWLPRNALAVYKQTFTLPGPPNAALVRLTSDPTWIGRAVSFQARIASAAAPAGAAFSNPVTFTLLP